MVACPYCGVYCVDSGTHFCTEHDLRIEIVGKDEKGRCLWGEEERHEPPLLIRKKKKKKDKK